MYVCKECGAPVVVTGETLERSCEHTESPVIVELVANCTGEGLVD